MNQSRTPGQRQISQDGRWEWDGQRWLPRTPKPPKKRMGVGARLGIAVAIILGGLILIGTISALATPSKPTASVAGTQTPANKATSTPQPTHASTPKPTEVPTPKPTPKPATPPPAPVTLVDAMGNASGETGPFDTSGRFKVHYTFDCSSVYGGSGNFIVTPIDANGNDLAGPEVNRLAASGDGVADGYTLGSQKQMRLQVISECSWHVTVTTA